MYIRSILRYQFLDFCGLSLLCGLQDMWLCCRCCALCWSCTPITAKEWAYRQMWWRRWIQTAIRDHFWGSESARRVLGWGGIFSLAASLCRAQRDLKKKGCLSCTKLWMKCVYKGKKERDFVQENNQGRYLYDQLSSSSSFARSVVFFAWFLRAVTLSSVLVHLSTSRNFGTPHIALPWLASASLLRLTSHTSRLSRDPHAFNEYNEHQLSINIIQ